jgi:hypothetical protein
MAITTLIRLLLATCLTIVCAFSFFINIFVAIVICRTKQLRHLSIGYLVLFAAINDGILALLVSGGAISEWRFYLGDNIISQQQCYFEGVCKCKYLFVICLQNNKKYHPYFQEYSSRRHWANLVYYY